MPTSKKIKELAKAAKYLESQIIYECGNYWVGSTKDSYTVYKNGEAHYSTPESSYPKTEDGLSIAKARCKYRGSK